MKTERIWKIIYKTYPLYHHGEKSRLVRAKYKSEAEDSFRSLSPDTKIISSFLVPSNIYFMLPKELFERTLWH